MEKNELIRPMAITLKTVIVSKDEKVLLVKRSLKEKSLIPEKWKQQSVLVIGAGFMGAGIAQVCAQSGYRVHLNDVKPEALDKAEMGNSFQQYKGEKRKWHR